MSSAYFELFAELRGRDVGVVEERETYKLKINSLEEYYTYSQEKNGLLFIPNKTWPILFNYDEPENVVVDMLQGHVDIRQNVLRPGNRVD